MSLAVTLKGFDELKKAIKENPEFVKTELQKFFVRAMSTYKSIINNNPWRVGEAGGGVPVKSGFLRKVGHDTVFEEKAAYLKVKTDQVPYAVYVHEGTKKMTGRPWLDYAVEQGQSKVDELEEGLLNAIAEQLAS